MAHEPVGRSGERRWPMATAVVVAGVLHQLLPEDFRVSPAWVYPSFLAVLLIVLIVGDPGRIDRQRPWLQVATGLMVGLIAVANGIAAGRLVSGILSDAEFDNPTQLLLIGAVVWVTNVLAFALWFWNVDSGGAAARAAGSVTRPAFVFPEMTMSQYVSPSWYPTFPDYLALSFNTALAFGPTDVSAIRVWAKLAMIVESLISISLAALVIARAVNIL
jgi:hypothetical protein